MKILALLFIIIGLSGCATTQPNPSPYGNFVIDQIANDQQKMANDTIEQLVSLYPPAKTQFELKHSMTDVFGAALVAGMRDRGFAILEFNPVTEETDGDGLPLRYVVDQFTDANLYRITVLIGDQSITRAYTKQNGTVLPAGYWVRKE
ncbi:hypothetical protein [Hahella ganghwensis]|uniref:hypothetical protein n=1 Tax=Hahella ganghwensis TaxID=286420 RepID=UPI00036E3029|nr:hypothetical protein [Hahella ganghwensis]